MALIRKQRAGSDSYGHTWPEDGAVVEIEDGEQIASLVAIPDGGFSEVAPDADEEPEAPDPDDPPADPEAPEEEEEEEDEEEEKPRRRRR